MFRKLALALVLLLSPLSAWATCRDTNDCNMIVIIVDDVMLAEISAYGTRLGAIAGDPGTPAIDDLASDGVRFTNAYVVTPLCRPNRSTLYTGLYPNLHAQRGNQTDNSHFWAQTTLPGLLRDAGYTTALLGKSHLAAPPLSEDGGPFDYFSVLSTDQGNYDNPRFYQCYPGSLEACRTISALHGTSGGCLTISDYADVNCYFTDELTRMTTSLLDEIHDDGPPWAVFVSNKATHGQYVPAERHATLFAADTPVMPTTLTDDRSGRAPQVVDYPQEIYPVLYTNWTTSPFNASRPTGFDKEDPPVEVTGGTDADKAAWVTGQLIEDKLETLTSVDEQVAIFRTWLVDNGHDDDTIILFTSDNGFQTGAHGLSGKDVPYRESMRIPLIMAGPGITAGQVKTQLVSFSDLAPTLLDLAGVVKPANMPGRTLFDIVPNLVGGAWRTALLVWSSWEPDSADTEQSPWYAAVTDDWMLVRHYDNRLGDVPVWELIDESGDESDDVYNVAANATVRKQMKQTLRGLLEDNGMPGWQDTRLSTSGGGTLP